MRRSSVVSRTAFLLPNLPIVGRAGINLGRVQSGNKFAAAAAADCKCRCLASSFISADYPAPVSLIQRAGF
jgi:hypothetical protein